MSDFIIKVRSKSGEPVKIIPDTLVISPVIDIDNQIAAISYRLTDSGEFDTNIFEYRQRSVNGKLKNPMPLMALMSIKNQDGTINVSVLNQILAAFDLEYDEPIETQE